MGTYIIKTPDIGEGIAEVELVAWHVKVGDAVALDQVIADVMTDKATVEVPSPVAGTVVSLGGTVGQTIAVGSELVRLEVQSAGNQKALESGRMPVHEHPIAEIQKLPQAEHHKPVAVPARPESVTAPGHDRPIASPAVRRRAWELGVELAEVAGTGPAGRILLSDLESFSAAHPPKLPVQQLSRLETPPKSSVVGSQANTPPSDVSVSVIGLRRKIAMKMQESKRRIPHFTYVEEVDVTELETLRERLNEQWRDQRERLTILPLLTRALVLALHQFPQMNARFDDDHGVVTRHGAVHLGLATQTDNGLMVPVLRDAQNMGLWSVAAEILRLSQAARGGRATREELSGSTITITSLGPLGGIVTTPVINHPEVAIIGVNRIVERPVVQRGNVVVRKMMNLSSSFDHRVIDGLDAAKFVQAIRGYLEMPATLFIA